MNIPNQYTLPNIFFVGGATQELAFRCYAFQHKRPFDLFSCTANFAIINYNNKNGTPRVSKEMEIRSENGVDGDVANILYVELEPSDTANLVGKFIYQITIRDISGEVEIPDQGIIHIANNINKSFVQQ